MSEIPTPASYGSGPERDFYDAAGVLLSQGKAPSELAAIVQDALAWARQEAARTLYSLPEAGT